MVFFRSIADPETFHWFEYIINSKKWGEVFHRFMIFTQYFHATVCGIAASAVSPEKVRLPLPGMPKIHCSAPCKKTGHRDPAIRPGPCALSIH